MKFALLIILWGTGTNTVDVGTFDSMDECQKAAGAAVIVNRSDPEPHASRIVFRREFICVRRN